MKKILLPIIIGLFLISLVTAETQSLGTFKQGDEVNLIQTCQNCTYVNLSSVIYPNSNFALLGEFSMDKNGTVYNYTFSDTNNYLGNYIYTTHGDLNGIDTIGTVSFEVTPSGQSGISNIAFIILILIGLFTLNLLGFFNRNATITILGGIGLTFAGLYMIENGIIIYRDNLTIAVSYITLFWGLGSSLWATLEDLEIF